MKKPVLLIVDDDKNTREGLDRALKHRYEVYVAENATRALEIMRESAVDAVLSDIRMPGMDGLTLMKRTLARSPAPVCILMTAYGSIDKAVEAMKVGASDYVTKPYDLDDVEMRLEKALRARDIEYENVSLKKQLDDRYGLEGIIGNSDAMKKVLDMIRHAAPTQATVLLEGESGTGKELVAHAIHQLSPRAKGPFIAVHCAALSSNLVESELFGHEKGSFTGASERRPGRFELADGGSLFLDEVSEIDASTQTKLLRVLEERRFERVGGRKTIETDIRLIAATNKNLKALVEKGEFREDLFFRLNVVNIDIPPLRHRLDDVPMLCKSFVSEFAQKNGKAVSDISDGALAMLSAYSWPGNVRELRNAIEKMVIFSRGKKLSPKDIPSDIRSAVGQPDGSSGGESNSPGFAPASMEEAEKMMIMSALRQHHGNRTNAAKQLGISRRTLHRKLKQYQDLEAKAKQANDEG
jgi:DNA-binding NtrC family response regulator